MLNSCLYSILSVGPVETTFVRRGFYDKGNRETISHLEEIGRKFLKGYKLGFFMSDADKFFDETRGELSEYCGFVYEGAAMAKTILDCISFNKKNRLKQWIEHTGITKHLYMFHVGVGWAYAKLSIKVEKKIKQFDPILRWLIIDGYGFHQAYFKTRKYVFNRIEPKELKSQFSKHVFYQGMGRCLWFVEGADPFRIYDRIKLFPEIYQADLWSGVGLACTYAGGAKEGDIKEITNLSGIYLPHLMQGSAFAAKARERAKNVIPYTEMACRIICKMSVYKVSSICDKCLLLVSENSSSEEKYEMWRNLIRSSLYKSSHHESIREEIFN